MSKVAWIGLGVMGGPMAGHLQKAGHSVTVYNRTAHRAEAWVNKYGGDMAGTPAQAAKGCDIVFACVGNDDDLRAVTVGENGAFGSMDSGTIFVDHTTASASAARGLYAEAKSRGIGFIDAPVSGGEAGAQNGVLTVMCGGDQDVFEKVAPVLDAFARSAKRLGDAGAGQLTKMVNQICIAGVVQGLAEGMNFAQKAGLDGDAVLDVISKGAAGSWQMENRGSTMLKDEFEFGFAVDWMRKDLGMCLQEADGNGATLPLTALVDQFYKEVQSMGGGRWDTSSLMRRLNRDN